MGLSACGDKAAETSEQTVDTTAQAVDTGKSAVNEVVEFKFHLFLSNIPSPMESMVLIPDAGIAMDKSLLNPTENAGSYSTLAKKALNYGVYGTDLGYLAAFEQTEIVTDYFATVKTLADELGASAQFDNVMSDRFQANLSNRDSMLIIMDKAIAGTEEFMKNNQRLEMASLMIAGAWVESQYILVRSLIQSHDKGDLTKLYGKLPEQKNHLKSLVDLLGEQATKDCKAMQAELEALMPLYAGINSVDNINGAVLKQLSDKLKPVKDKITATK